MRLFFCYYFINIFYIKNISVLLKQKSPPNGELFCREGVFIDYILNHQNNIFVPDKL